MTAIEGIGGPNPTKTTGRTPHAASAEFTLPPEPAASGAAAAAAPPQAASLGAMLTLQELGCETVEDREARKHGQAMLALLAALQRALLTGGSQETVLAQLAGLVGTAPQATDRRLAAMVAAIMVRVRVELARHQT
jgi:hypothetical protein